MYILYYTERLIVELETGEQRGKEALGDWSGSKAGYLQDRWVRPGVKQQKRCMNYILLNYLSTVPQPPP